MKKGIIFAALLTCVMAAPASAQNVRGPAGFGTCGDWLTARRTQGVALQRAQVWTMGFLSGMNQIHYLTFNNEDVLASLSTESMWHWLDRHCSQHPLDGMPSALLRLFVEAGEQARGARRGRR